MIHLGPQPLGRGRGARRAAGRRRRDRAVLLPGRPRRILQVHGRHAARARRLAHQRVRRRRRHDHAGRNPRTAGLRRRAHLPPERRHAHGPGRDDRGRRAPRRTPRAWPVENAAPGRPRPTRSPSAACSARSKKARSTKPNSRTCASNGNWRGGKTPVIGITGTGGAGKSSVTDELLNRFLASFPDMRIAVISVDPTRRRTGGALLGDRIRMNSLRSKRVFMRSMATRRQHVATNIVLKDCIAFLKSLGYDLVIVETAGIGQSDSEIVDLVDFPMYVMTSDFGAPSQLEKIDMLDYAELVVLNKFDKRGAEDALRDVRKQWKRNRVAFQTKDEDVPVYPTIASQFNDPGISWMFANLTRLLRDKLQPAGGRVDAAHRHHAEGTARHRADPRRPRALPRRDRRAGPRHQPAHRSAERNRRPRAELLAIAARPRRRRAAEGARSCTPPTPLQAQATTARSRTLRQRYNDAIHRARQRSPQAAARVARAPEVDHRRSQRIQGARQGDPRRELPRIAVAPEDPEDRRAHLPQLGRTAHLPAEGKPAGRVPLHRRRVSVPPHRRRSRPACSPAKARPSAPTAASIT